MIYTVNKLAKLSGVTIRTLRFYDEIGLLKPAFIGEQGYRYYQEKQLLILQQILFYRDLGFELKQIQDILEQTDANRIQALQTQKELLSSKLERMHTLMKTIDTTINHLKRDKPMKEKEMFEGFETWEPESDRQKNYEKQLEEYLAKKSDHQTAKDLMQGNQKVKNWTKEDWKKVANENDALSKDLLSAMEKHQAADSQEVQQIVRRHYENLKKFWIPNKATYAAHADLILETKLRGFYDKYHPKLAEFLAKAIKIFASREL